MITGFATPENTALTDRPGRMPLPTASMTARSEVPISTSPTSGATTSPTTVATIVPDDSSVPIDRNHSAPRARMCGTFESVSTLFTSVGFGPAPVSEWLLADDSQPSWGDEANSPCSCGANQRGSGGRPSITSSIAFSSPNRYSSGPATTVTEQSPHSPAVWNSWMAVVTRSISRSNRAFRQTNTSEASTVIAAMIRPSTS